jgi:TRAP-type transport system small permease protein
MAAFFESVKKIEPFYQAVYNVFLCLCKLLLLADILITCYIVVARYITAVTAPTWGEEIILTLMSYMAVLSATLAIRRNAHIRMTAFDNYLPKKVVDSLDLLSDVVMFILAIIMICIGWSYAKNVGSVGTYVSLTWLSRFWMYFPIPLAGIGMLFFEVERILLDLEKLVMNEEEVKA